MLVYEKVEWLPNRKPMRENLSICDESHQEVFTQGSKFAVFVEPEKSGY